MSRECKQCTVRSLVLVSKEMLRGGGTAEKSQKFSNASSESTLVNLLLMVSCWCSLYRNMEGSVCRGMVFPFTENSLNGLKSEYGDLRCGSPKFHSFLFLLIS